MSYGRWAPYVSVAQRRAKAAKEMKKLVKKGLNIQSVVIEGRKIARTFWGAAWCNHLEKFSDYANRLPRGRTYVRNGSVCHLAISEGKVEAIVSGSSLYKVNIEITPFSAKKWKSIRKQCFGQIGSILELLQGRFSDNVMNIVTHEKQGLFPLPGDIKLSCNCPDWAELCKHIAAVLYGVGARLDHQPELLFLLRNVDHQELITAELNIAASSTGTGKRRRLATKHLSGVFGVDMEEPAKPVRKKKMTKKKSIQKTTKKKAFSPTATAIVKLRKRFVMNLSEFAKLVNVGSTTVKNWENGKGKLNLQKRSLDALEKVAELTAEQAMKKLKDEN
ncbi:zinc finger, SWIM-type [hydrothermal vent metagenome]|uniref:Zinc finger, SWIM-type n=1 Tax=hydrothermal vent metagenome TaxID=652676 RepID=A0A3B0Z2V1_9ZZZZ